MLDRRAQAILDRRAQAIIDSARKSLAEDFKKGKLGNTTFSYSQEAKEEMSENAELAIQSLMREDWFLKL